MNWQSQIIELLTASLIRPIVLAAAAWLILRIYKVRHPASRHAVWTAVLIGMMVLPLVTFFVPQWNLPLLPRKPEPVSQTQLQLSNDFTDTESSDVRLNTVASASQQAVKFAWPAPQTLIAWVYFAGVLAMAIFRLMGWALLWRVMSKSRLLRTHLLESNEVATPVTVGVFRPSVILPAGWRDWNASTKRAVLAHEFAHIRRRDTLTSSATRLAKCIYWFHPLAWWVSRQISELAELSCDAAALEINGDPGSYSRILLGFAETVHAAGYRVALPGLAIASRSGMSHRIDQVFELASGNLRRLSRPGAVLVLMGLPVMCIAAVVGLTAPAARVLHKAAAAIIPSPPVVLAQLQPPVAVPAKPAQPEFEVASIRPAAPGIVAGTGRGGGGGCPESFRTSPGRLEIGCVTLGTLIAHAFRVPPYRIAGPDWIDRQGPKFDIEATFSETVPESQIPEMLQALLNTRFGIVVHRGSREQEIYALVTAKGGLKVKNANTEAAVPTLTVTEGPDNPPGAITAFGGLQTRTIRVPNADGTGYTTTRSNPRIGTVRQTDGPNFATHLEAPSTTFEGLADLLGLVGLPLEVVDMTRLQGRYQIILDFSLSAAFAAAAAVPQPGGDPSARDNARTDMQNAILSGLNDGLLKLGLQLERRKGTVETLVIDHLEKTPTVN